MKFKQFLKSKGVTQKELANAINHTEYGMSKWVNGKRNPTIFNLKRMSDYLGVSMDYLYQFFKHNAE